MRKEEWSAEEDKVIMELVQRYGTKWSKIVKYLPGRTDNAIKNRWNSTMRKNLRRQLKEAGNEPQALMKITQLAQVDSPTGPTTELPVRKRGAATSAEIATAAAAAAVTAAAAAAAAAGAAKIVSPRFNNLITTSGPTGLAISSPRPYPVNPSPRSSVSSSAPSPRMPAISPKGGPSPRSPGVRKRSQAQVVRTVHKVVQAVQAVPVQPIVQAVQAVPAPPPVVVAPGVLPSSIGSSPLAPHALSEATVQQSPLGQYHSACNVSVPSEAESVVPSAAQQQQFERQRMLAEEDEEASGMQVSSDGVSLELPAAMMQIQQEAGSVMAPAMAPAWDGMEATAGEESWAEQVMSSDWITSTFDEHTSLNPLDEHTQAGLQRLIEDVH